MTMIIKAPLEPLINWCNPFTEIVWPGLSEPITKEEVEAAIKEGPCELLEFPDPWNRGEIPRTQHVQQIAALVQQGIREPIHLDVGVPSLGCFVAWPVEDGNHRVAAAIYRGDTHIRAYLSGQIDYAEEIFGELILEEA